MGFPTQKSKRSLSEALSTAQNRAGTVKRICINNRDTMASGDISAGAILSLLGNLVSAKQELEEIANVRDITKYARAQLGQEVNKEFIVLINELDGAINWIITNTPKYQDYILIQTINTDGSITERKFAPHQTKDLRAALDNVIAAID